MAGGRVTDVDEQLMTRLGHAGMAVSRPMRWAVRQRDCEVQLPVDNDLGTPLVLTMRVPFSAPWKPVMHLRHGESNDHLYRLCVHRPHRQPRGHGQRVVMLADTHKHMWTALHDDQWAYEPDDIPALPADQTAQGELEVVFRAFCGEIGIDVQTAWRQPPIPRRVEMPELGAT